MLTDEITGSGEVTQLLRAARRGDHGALDRVVPLVYDELRQMARRQLARERGPRTLQPTALVHDAYLKLLAGGVVEAVDRPHFLAIAAHAMRQVLVDQARSRNAAKRGAGWERTTLGERGWADPTAPEEMLALNEAIDRLEPRQRRVVEYRFFGGLQEAEIAAVLGVTVRTVRRDWVKARAWLYREIYGDAAE